MPGSHKLGDVMDRTEMIEMQKILLEKIADADMVLVGIGEEFNESFGDIGKFPRLMSALDEVEINQTLVLTRISRKRLLTWIESLSHVEIIRCYSVVRSAAMSCILQENIRNL